MKNVTILNYLACVFQYFTFFSFVINIAHFTLQYFQAQYLKVQQACLNILHEHCVKYFLRTVVTLFKMEHIFNIGKKHVSPVIIHILDNKTSDKSCLSKKFLHFTCFIFKYYVFKIIKMCYIILLYYWICIR